MHRFIPDPGDTAPTPPEHTAAIRRWTREVLGIPEDVMIMVTDTPCADPGCPLIESIVTVFEASETRAWAFTRPAVAVTKTMIQQTLATPPRRQRPANNTPGGRSEIESQQQP
jgi:hypothetical protein